MIVTEKFTAKVCYKRIRICIITILGSGCISMILINPKVLEHWKRLKIECTFPFFRWRKIIEAIEEDEEQGYELITIKPFSIFKHSLIYVIYSQLVNKPSQLSLCLSTFPAAVLFLFFSRYGIISIKFLYKLFLENSY